ncbi:hypothetical protein FACS1894205_2360 [Alphaproteobacteria bacterium]|nr:hypothetical protein FACS1894205_2360 [Alphaproteobacteria bacterium]
MFVVRGVPADVSAPNAEEARSKAMMAAQRAAFDTVMRRLVSPPDLKGMPPVADQEIVGMVIDVAVDEEKSSPVRYIARMSVRFKPDAIRGLLQKNDLAYAEWRNPPVAILPVWPVVIEDSDAAAVNPWRAAWLSDAAQGIVPFLVQSPERCAEAGQTLVGASQEELERFADRIGARDMLISWVSIGEAGGNLLLSVKTRATGVFATTIEGSRNYQGPVEAGQAPLFEKAVADIARTVNSAFRDGNALKQGKVNSLLVTAPLRDGLEEWVSLRKKLMRSSAIRGYEVNLLTRDRAALTLYYVGDAEQLERNFVQNGLVLMWMDDHWEVADSERS